MLRRPRFILFVLPLGVAACATGGEFPSLAPRAVEQLSMEEPIRVDPPVAEDPSLRTLFTALLGAAQEGNGDFSAAYARALPLVRAAGAVGSESWIQAQEAISRAQAAGKDTSRALGDLDTLVAEQATRPTNEVDYQELLEARARAAALVADQQRRLNELSRAAGRP